jgi:hypothetical protein
MRITDDRYTRDRQRFDLAFRMIHHEARTSTIRSWTGLSDERIRKLYRSYVESHGASIKRHRGRPPAQTYFFMRNREARRHTSALAGLFKLLGLLDAAHRPQEIGSGIAQLRSAELFCRTFETYTSFYQPTRISFEHAAYLLDTLRLQRELKAVRCPACSALMVVDQLRLLRTVCTWCETDERDTKSTLAYGRLASRQSPALS